MRQIHPGDGAGLMGDLLPFRPADRRHDVVTPEGEPGQFVGIINELARQWASRREHRTSMAGLVADVIDIRSRRPVLDLEAVLATLGRPMTELEVVLARFGAAIAERERQRHAAEEKPE
jgi:hypothetical protein